MNSAYQEYEVLHPVVRAVRVAPVSDADQPTGERAYVIDGVGVLDAATFASLYRPRLSGVPVKAKEPRPRKKNHKRQAVQLPSGDPVTVGPSAAIICAALAKEPLTSGDLIKRSGLSAPSVYSALDGMRKKGLVESRNDDQDGQRKNYLTGTGGARG